MSKRQVFQRAARAAVSAAALAPAFHGLASEAEAPFSFPAVLRHHDPVGRGHLLERMAIDTESRPERVTLSIAMDEEAFILFQVATPEGRVLRSGSWLLQTGDNALTLDAKGWPEGTLELSILTRTDLMKVPFER